MCYQIYVSTTSLENLAALPTEFFRFERPSAEDRADVLALLEHPHKWYLASRYGGCSCHYRFIGPPLLPLGNSKYKTLPLTTEDFDTPQDWMPEDEDDVEATGAVFDVLRRLLEGGHSVDAIAIWTDSTADKICSLDVPWRDVSRETFRFFESYHVMFT